MNTTLRTLAKWSALAFLLSNAGCNAKEMSDARRDHLLARDHGWIDLTVKAPTGAPGFDAKAGCLVSLAINGEPLLMASADLAQADAAGIPVGYLFVAPAGKLEAALTISGCVKDELVVKFPLQLDKDHRVDVQFDGKAASAGAAIPYAPTSLEWVRTEMLRMQANANASDAAVAKLTRIAIASVALNALGVLGLLAYAWIRRRR